MRPYQEMAEPMGDCLSRRSMAQSLSMVYSAAQGLGVPVADAVPQMCNVLVVDDHPINLEVASRMVERLGHTCTTAGTGDEALCAVQGEDFDLILMDLQMPDMDGFEVTRRIRARERAGCRRPQIIGVTASLLEAHRDQAMWCGMDECIAKPFSFTELRRLVDKARTVGPPGRLSLAPRTQEGFRICD